MSQKIEKLEKELARSEKELDLLYIKYAKLLESVTQEEKRLIDKQVDKIIRIKQELEFERKMNE